MIAPSTWPRSTSSGGSFASSSTSAAEIARPCMTPPRISSTFVSRAESASAFATATMSPSASMNAIADGPSSSASSASAPAASAARRVSVFLTTESRAPCSSSLPAQGVDLRHRQAAVVGDDQRVRAAELLRQLGDDAFLVFFLHLTSFARIGPPDGGPMVAGGVQRARYRLGWASAALRGCQLSLARAC